MPIDKIWLLSVKNSGIQKLSNVFFSSVFVFYKILHQRGACGWLIDACWHVFVSLAAQHTEHMLLLNKRKEILNKSCLERCLKCIPGLWTNRNQRIPIVNSRGQTLVTLIQLLLVRMDDWHLNFWQCWQCFDMSGILCFHSAIKETGGRIYLINHFPSL